MSLIVGNSTYTDVTFEFDVKVVVSAFYARSIPNNEYGCIIKGCRGLFSHLGGNPCGVF